MIIRGNIAHSCVTLAEAFPNLEFSIRDILHVVEEGIKVARENNEVSIAERIKFQEYDFFEKEPVEGADVYLFRQMFHIWDFENSVKILKNTVESMSEGSRVLIMDFVIPEPCTVSSITSACFALARSARCSCSTRWSATRRAGKAILEAMHSINVSIGALLQGALPEQFADESDMTSLIIVMRLCETARLHSLGRARYLRSRREQWL
ncbi:hypothetical protein DL764_002433 [Monosporascus ibericus]|uniref:O-methyltransferase C-terminal domain-containing protein n=1 Tax=Monosporascus ibericus TaxID=155417 RepID=A0A4V1XBV2_9PEZI|nr:hypothetical protein DL764_002433 [Monosporascus ibericus]